MWWTRVDCRHAAGHARADGWELARNRFPDGSCGTPCEQVFCFFFFFGGGGVFLWWFRSSGHQIRAQNVFVG